MLWLPAVLSELSLRYPDLGSPYAPLPVYHSTSPLDAMYMLSCLIVQYFRNRGYLSYSLFQLARRTIY